LLKLKSTWPAVIRRQSTQSHFGAPIWTKANFQSCRWLLRNT
jgi:hypothetical protein